MVWAILISKEKKDSKTAIPVYRAGVAFSDTLSEKANMLLDFIEENKIKTFENRIGSVRFKTTKTKNIKIELPHKYKVKKISLAGMLAETEYPLEIDSHHDIELFLNLRRGEGVAVSVSGVQIPVVRPCDRPAVTSHA